VRLDSQSILNKRLSRSKNSKTQSASKLGRAFFLDQSGGKIMSYLAVAARVLFLENQNKEAEEPIAQSARDSNGRFVKAVKS
jgi:hypothetical protein